MLNKTARFVLGATLALSAFGAQASEATLKAV